ncbi:hypothetical protein LUZ60_013635 [Juncus effusus]|nr:hypothetical protein LUZ60_013635 [Juncus effusus]
MVTKSEKPTNRFWYNNIDCASEALRLDGTTIGTNPGRVRVRTSLSYIIPVNPFFLPRNEVEKGKAIRTVYCRNIDREMTEEEVRDFFDQSCGEVSQMRLFGDLNSYTRNAFIEFANEDYAKAALGLSGAKLGSLILSLKNSDKAASKKTDRLTSAVHCFVI